MEGDFFTGIEQIEISIGGFKARAPVFFRRARSFSAVFPAPLWRVRKVLPDRRFVPAQLAPGVAAVQMTALEYYDADIPPYNEFSVVIPLCSPQFLPLPGYNMLRQMLRNEFEVYFLHLPVTTEIAMRGGIDYYGFPKFLASIDFSDTQEWVECGVKEEGETICTLRGRKIDAVRSGVMKMFCHLYQDRQPQTAEGKINARSYAMSFKPADAELSLGISHPIAVELSGLLLSTRPLMYMYTPDFQLILYGPERISLPLLKFSLETMGIAPERAKEKELAKSGK